jgi:signal transduction histidine kinase/CheY-like chemotaxis protein
MTREWRGYWASAAMSQPMPPTRASRQPLVKGGPVAQRLRAWFVRMSFRTKFLVVGLLVAGPLCALAGYAAAQFHAQVLVTQARAEALERAARARDVTEALALHRGLTATVLAGGEGLSSRLVQQQQRVEETLLLLLAVLPEQDERRADLPGAIALAAEVRALKSLPDALDPLRNFERHNLVIDQLLVLMHRTGTRGAASNAPQLAGAYHLAFVSLPTLLESLGRQRGWGSAVLQQEQFSDAEIARHLMFAGAVAHHLELMQADRHALPELDRLMTDQGAPAGSVTQRLQAAIAEAEVFSQRSIAQVYGRQGGSDAALQHFAEGSTAIERLLQASRELTTALQQRTLTQQALAERWRLASLLGLLLVVLMLALIYIEFERSTVLRLRRLQHASHRIADGLFEDSISVEGSDEIASLADAFDAMRKRLRQAVQDNAQVLAARESERARTEFLARWSHDLRTPLAAVLGFSRLLGERDAGGLSGHQQADLQRIQTAAEHLLNLVDDVLAISSDELREVSFRPQALDLQEVAADAVAMNLPEAARRGIRVESVFDDLPAASADRTRLLQVLGNLVGNAVKFNRDGGWVSLRGRVEGAELRVDVSDSGPGIAVDQLPRLFRPFERLDADARGVPGTGLGLATSKRLVEAMQGRIGAQSAPGQGCVFSLWLPLATAAEDRSIQGTSPPPKQPLRGRVAYVEDNETNVELLRAMLAARTVVELTVYPDGASALAAAADFDLWIIDRQLPDTDGIALLDTLRRQRGADLRAVMFTADALPQRRAEALAAGFADCWTKPIALDAMEQALRAVLGRAPDGPTPR